MSLPALLSCLRRLQEIVPRKVSLRLSKKENRMLIFPYVTLLVASLLLLRSEVPSLSCTFRGFTIRQVPELLTSFPETMAFDAARGRPSTGTADSSASSYF